MSHLACLGGPAVCTRPFPAWPASDAGEEESVLQVLRSGRWWANSQGESRAAAGALTEGSKVAEFEKAFAREHDAAFGVACASGAAALEIALRAAGVGPGDEVIVPAYTFVATSSAPLLLGAIPRFCDVERDTLNLDPKSVEAAIGPRTRAIIPVHFAGRAADMESILNLARTHRLFVLEDAAHGHGGTWNHRGQGSIGDAGIFSFQASKNMTAGEGGIVLTQSEAFAELCESYVWVGRKVGRPWYEHHRLARNFRLTELQAAILIEQLKRLAVQTAKRQENAAWLDHQLAQVPGISCLRNPPWATRVAHHIYIVRFNEQAFGLSRDTFLKALAAEGVPCMGGYSSPLYRNPMFTDPASRATLPGGLEFPWQSFADSCPNAEQACREAVWIEHRVLLGSRADVEQVVEAVWKIHRYRDELS